MKPRPVLEVVLAGPGSLVRGYGSRDMVERISGRPPVWIPRLRGWSCQEQTARDVVGLAEVGGYDVVIVGKRLVEERWTPPTPEPAEVVVEVEGPGLW